MTSTSCSDSRAPSRRETMPVRSVSGLDWNSSSITLSMAWTINERDRAITIHRNPSEPIMIYPDPFQFILTHLYPSHLPTWGRETAKALASSSAEREGRQEMPSEQTHRFSESGPFTVSIVAWGGAAAVALSCDSAGTL